MQKMTRWMTLLATSAVAFAGAALAQSGQINGNRSATSGQINGGRDTSGSGNTAAAGSAGATGVGHAPFAPVPSGYNAAMVQTWAAQAAGKKVVYIDPAVVGDKDMTNILRVALGKMWNHLSWAPNIDIPQDISNGAGLAWAIDINNMWGSNATANWGAIANCTASPNASVRPGPTDFCKTFDANAPVPIPQLVENMANDGVYDNIHNTPADFQSFQQKFNLGSLQYTSTHHDAIVCGPRIVGYRQVAVNGQNLWYSFTTDEFDGRDGGNINYTNAPTDSDQRDTGSFNAGPGDSNTAVASEWWMQLPNGFMYWGIHGEGGQQRGQAEFPFAIDPMNWATSESALQTGHSCIACHASGIHGATSDASIQGQNGWTSQTTLNQFYAQVSGKFQTAMGTVIKGMSDAPDTLNQQMISGLVEPISRAFMLVEGRYNASNPNGQCTSFCDGKFAGGNQSGSTNANACAQLPASADLPSTLPGGAATGSSASSSAAAGSGPTPGATTSSGSSGGGSNGGGNSGYSGGGSAGGGGGGGGW